MRAHAFDLLGRSAGTGAGLLARIGRLAVTESGDPDTRALALGAVRQLALERPDLADASRAALLEAAEWGAISPELRGDALSSIHAGTASASEIERIASFLAAADAPVREAAALALVEAPPTLRANATGPIEQAFARETGPDVGAALALAALRVARSEAPALLERLAATPLARQNVAVGRQLDDYRALLAAGETDPLAIARAHEQREDAQFAR